MYFFDPLLKNLANPTISIKLLLYNKKVNCNAKKLCPYTFVAIIYPNLSKSIEKFRLFNIFAVISLKLSIISLECYGEK